MKRRGLIFNSQPNKAVIVALGLMLMLCPASRTWAYANVNDSRTIAQSQKQVKGQVVDAKGEPVIGASILEKGTTNGVISDIDGNFSLNVSSPNAVIVISYIGFKSMELPASDPKLRKIIMKEDTEVLDEVVVVGYGTQRKESLTGAVTVVGAKQLENKGTMSSPLQAMQGTVPGVLITRNSGAPGDESWGMKLRGASSSNSTDPLIIVDGVEYSDGINGMRNLNPDDIESINFLKDASAAIYGSKAAGGVVLITTKKAKAGKTVVQYNGSFTGKVVGLQPELMSLDQWADAVITAQTNDGYSDSNWIRYARLAKLYKNQYIDLSHSAHPIPEGFKDVEDFVFMDNDWQDILWGNSWSTQHDLSVSGGTEKNLFRLSLGYMYDNSTLKWGNNNNQRYNMRLNNQFKLSDAVMLTSSIGYNRQDQVSPSMIGKVLSQSSPQPGLPASTIDGRPYGWGTWRALNWWAEEGGDNKLKVSAINISESLNWKIYSDLDAVVNVGYNTSTATREKVEKSIDWYNYAGGFIRSREEFAWPNIQYHFLPVAINYNGSNAVKEHGFQCHVGSMRSPSRGHVRIKSRDPHQHPAILFNYMSHEQDWQEFRDAIRITREIMHQPALDQYRGREISPGTECQTDEQLDEFVRNHAETAFHPCGTCKMGYDEMSVVDGEGRVHGLEGLRVVDASIMPQIITGNLNATTIMIGEKIADMIRGQEALPRSTAGYFVANGMPVRAKK